MDFFHSPFVSKKDSPLKASSNQHIWALKDVSFKIGSGEIVGIIGRNGAGKSTLLKILSQITPPTKGKIILRGRVASLLEVGTGFHPELTGRENVYLNGAILGMKNKEIRRKFDEIIDFAEIPRFIDTPVKFYSSGMYTRLAFAVAAHLEPEILIVDEVLAVGDVNFQKKCLSKMDNVASQGRTVLFVSHNMAAIIRLVQKCILLENGILTKIGKPNKVVDYYLQKNLSKSGEITYPIDDTKAGQLLRVGIKDASDRITSILNPADDITIEVDFLIRDTSRGKIDIIVVIASTDGTLLWYWNTQEDPKFSSWEKGKSYLRVIFPGSVLNCGRYIVRAAVGLDMKAHHNHPNFGTGINIELSEDSEIGALGYNMQKKESLLVIKPKYTIDTLSE